MMCRKGSRGSAGVEMIFALCFFLAFAGLVHRFSFLALSAHTLDMALQNDVERMMITAGRPVCLEDMAEAEMVSRTARQVVFGRRVLKGIGFVAGRICEPR